MSYIAEIYFVDVFEDYGKRRFTYGDIVLLTLKHILPGMIFCYSLFCCVLHTWQNIFAELLMFSDRQFYKVNILNKFINPKKTSLEQFILNAYV